MRPYLPAIVIVAASVGLTGAGLLTARLFESPRDAFLRDVDERVEQAQRLLRDYEGGYPRLLAALEALPPASQPAGEPSAGQDQDVAVRAAEEARNQKRELLKGRFAAMGGESSVPGGGIASREQLRAVVEANAAMLDKALELVQAAINSSAEDGSGEGLRGENHAVATRLEAILLSYKADLKRRQAAAQRALAESATAEFQHVLTSWRQAHRQVGSLQMELAGTQGGTITLTEPAPPKPPPTRPPRAAQAPSLRPGPGPVPGPLDQDPVKRAFLGGLRRLWGGEPEQVQPPPERPESPAPMEPPPGNEAPAQPGTEPAGEEAAPAEAAGPARPAGPIVIQAVPPIEERIKQLRAQAQKVDADIAEAQQEADRLSGIIKGLEERLAKAQADADDAEKKMMALEDAGVSPSDPDALRRFTQQYNEQARRHRDSAREAAALRHGVIRDARPGGQEENDVLTKPLVPAAPGREMKPEAGIERFKGDLRIAQGQVETRRNLKKLIDTRITELEKHQQATQDRLAKAREWEATLVKEAGQIARQATDASIRAEQIEEEAIQILTEPGQRAAERAASAAEDASRAISDFYQKNAPQSPSPQVGFLSGYARSLVGDLKFGLALVYAQRADRLAAQERLLADAAAMGLDPATLSSEKASSEGGEAVSRSGTPSTQPAAIAQAVQDARGKAIEAAKAALEEYGKADSRLNRQWTLHTQIAAVHYLLASLEPGNASKQHLADALREYNAATRDRAERKEVRELRPVIERLNQAARSGSD